MVPSLRWCPGCEGPDDPPEADETARWHVPILDTLHIDGQDRDVRILGPARKPGPICRVPEFLDACTVAGDARYARRRDVAVAAVADEGGVHARIALQFLDFLRRQMGEERQRAIRLDAFEEHRAASKQIVDRDRRHHDDGNAVDEPFEFGDRVRLRHMTSAVLDAYCAP